MPEFVFRRAFPWVQKALTPVVPILGPDTFLSTLIPTVPIFGTQRLAEQKFAEIYGGLGNLEVFHDEVPQDRVRLYSAVELTHDDVPGTRWIRIGQIIRQGASAFSFVGFTTAVGRGASPSPATGTFAIAERSIWVGPGNRLAARANAMTAGGQMALRLCWVELVLGETVGFT